jgi:RHS repeat-associated protein
VPGSGEVLAYSSTTGSTTTTTVPVHDLIGSTMGLFNSSGSLATLYSYEPFGKPTMTGASSAFPYLFAGMEWDSSTGLYHTPARYYSPSLQRFLSEDPMGFAGGDVNLFAYAGNDPINNTDPSGLQFVGGGDIAGVAGGLEPKRRARARGASTIFSIFYRYAAPSLSN